MKQLVPNGANAALKEDAQYPASGSTSVAGKHTWFIINCLVTRKLIVPDVVKALLIEYNVYNILVKIFGLL
ncbi:hypothetical protein REC12_24765 [Desulfosporosinus sp. PR]|nr:hypothetical protein [Desulfosporosinus sp. PR]